MKFLSTTFILLFTLSAFSQLNQVDSKGRKQGEWAKTYEGTRVYEFRGQFKDDKPVGKFTYFYKSSKVKAVINHDENSTRSEAYFYHENGALMSYGIYRNQVKDSVWVNFGPSQRLSNTETYVNGKLNGKKVIYYISEDLNNKSQLPSVVSYYTNDSLHGDYTEYFEDQRIKVKGQYHMNTKDGLWTHYHVTGKPMMVIRYKKGVKHGWATGHDDTGKEIGKKYFYYGRHLEGKQLTEKMRQLKELGINPNE